jgi:hypothetical protein
VHVFRPRRARFTRLTLKYRYGGRHIVDRRRIQRIPAGDDYPGGWAYAIVSFSAGAIHDSRARPFPTSPARDAGLR